MQIPVPAQPAGWRGVGNILSPGLPADVVALALHQANEFLTIPGIAYALVDRIHQPQLPALPFDCGSVFSAIRFPAFAFVILRQHRELEFQAELIREIAELL